VTFTGIVRDLPDGPLQAMEIEHYPGMTEAALTEIAQTAIDRWATLLSFIAMGFLYQVR
jgi:molybdopterin synthase catalytic subunit